MTYRNGRKDFNKNSGKNDKTLSEQDREWMDKLLTMDTLDLEYELMDALEANELWRVEAILTFGGLSLENPLDEYMSTAAMNGNLDIIKALDRRFYDPALYQHAFYIAAKRGYKDIVEWMVDSGKVDVTERDSQVLVDAVTGGQLDIMQFLLEKGADPNAQKGKPLFVAAGLGAQSMIEGLVEKGARPSADDSAALQAASLRGHLKIAQYLIDNGADPNADEGMPLYQAVSTGNEAMLDLLLNNMDKSEPIAAKVMMQAAVTGNTKILDRLVEAGGNVNMPGTHMLSWAIRFGHEDMVKSLVHHKIDLKRGGLLALDSAIAFENPRIARYLIDCGVDPLYPGKGFLRQMRKSDDPDMRQLAQEIKQAETLRLQKEARQQFDRHFAKPYQMKDLRDKIPDRSINGLVLATQAGCLAQAIKGATDSAQRSSFLQADDLTPDMERVLGKHRMVADFFAPEFWVGRRLEMEAAWSKLPDKQKQQVDFADIKARQIHLTLKHRHKRPKPPSNR